MNQAKSPRSCRNDFGEKCDEYFASPESGFTGICDYLAVSIAHVVVALVDTDTVLSYRLPKNLRRYTLQRKGLYEQDAT